MKLSPPFGYHGGKARLAATIASHLPAHRVYVEPFAGSLAVLLAKTRVGVEMVNDLDGDLVNFWRQLRDHGDDLQAVLATTPYARAGDDAAWEPADNDLEAARRFWVRVQQGIAHKIATKSGWQCSAATRHSSTVLREVQGLPEVADRIRLIHIECRPAIDVMAMMDTPATLHYLDPPYVSSTHSGSSPYRHGMTDADHEDLAAACEAMKGTVVLSGYPSPPYDRLYDGWDRVEMTGRANTANRTGSSSTRHEVLWSNRPLGAQLDLTEAG